MEEQFFSYVQAGNIEAVRTMIAMCPGLVSAMNEDTDNALHLAASDRDPQMLQFLLELTHEPNVYGCSCRTPLHCAAYEGDTDCVRLLLRYGASLNWLDALEETPIHKAARCGHDEVLEELLNRKPSRAVLNQQNVLGCTALHQAMERGNEACTKLLLQAGCSTEIEDFFGCKPVFVPKPVPRQWMYQ